MEMRNEIVINAPPARIFRYASDTERWPEYLPHYRYVRVLERSADSQVVEMAARRSGIPVRWRAEQRNDPQTPAIHFRHLGGWTKGMDVQWLFEPVEGGTRVSIDHRSHLRFPMDWIVGKLFVDHIATRTLRRMKTLSEGSDG
jgi:ribosome-associated toxin RatA of RatAB toxin-antitoxin module